MTKEFRVVFHDAGVMLFFFALPLLYPITYTLIYNPEIVSDMPVAIVDQSQTVASRELIRKLDATQSMKIYTQTLTLDQARALMYEHKVQAIFVIPRDYARKIGRMEQAHVEAYCNMALLLRYRAIFASCTDIQIDLAQEITAERAGAAGLSGSTTMPIETHQNLMGDPTQGFASFVMPGVIILILQQSMLLGITLIGGTRRERRTLYGGYDPVEGDCPGASATVIGRALCYVLCYTPMCIYVLHWIPEIFALPHYGSLTTALLFIFPMLMATAFLGQAAVFFCRQREMPFVLIVFSSLVFLFLSGLTWPRYAMQPLWRWLGDIVPATWGVEGFIRINNNNATLADNCTPFVALWILSGVYLLCAYIVTRYFTRYDRRRRAHLAQAGLPRPDAAPDRSDANPSILRP